MLSEAQAKIDGQMVALETSVAQTVSQMQAVVDGQAQKLMDQVHELRAEIGAEAKAAIKRLASDLAAVQSAHSALCAGSPLTIVDLTQRIDAGFEKAKAFAQGVGQTFREVSDDLAADVRGIHDSLEAFLSREELAKSIADFQSELDSLAKRMTTSDRAVRASVRGVGEENQKLGERLDALHLRISDVSDDVKQEFVLVRKEIAQKASEKIPLLNEIQDKLNQLEGGNLARLVEEIQLVHEIFDNFQAETVEGINKLRHDLRALKRAQREGSDATAVNLSRLERLYVEDVAELRKSLQGPAIPPAFEQRVAVLEATREEVESKVEATAKGIKEQIATITSQLQQEVETTEAFKTEQATKITDLQSELKSLGEKYTDYSRRTDDLKRSWDTKIATVVSQRTDPIERFVLENNSELQRRFNSHSNETNLQIEKMRSEIRNLKDSLSEPEPTRPPIRGKN
jgi:hypothetical protein